MTEPVATPGARLRLPVFSLGLLAGLAAFAPVAVMSLNWTAPKVSAPSFDLSVSSDGAAVGAHGGRRVVIEGEHGRLTQDCNDACDDLLAQSAGAPAPFKVRVLDAAGRAVVPDAGGMSTGDPAAPKHIMIFGGDTLKIDVDAPPL